MKRIALAVLMIALLSVVAGCADRSSTLGGPTKFEKVEKECSGSAITVGDDGHSIIVDGVKDDIDDLVCVLIELDTPQSITAAMSSTTAMMGRQSGEADGIKYEWSYHPDNGMDVVITD